MDAYFHHNKLDNYNKHGADAVNLNTHLIYCTWTDGLLQQLDVTKPPLQRDVALWQQQTATEETIKNKGILCPKSFQVIQVNSSHHNNWNTISSAEIKNPIIHDLAELDQNKNKQKILNDKTLTSLPQAQICKFWIKKCFLCKTISDSVWGFLRGRKICSVDRSVLAGPHVFWEKEWGGRREELKESLFKTEPV